MHERMGVWFVMLVVAVIVGLPLNHTTIFAVSLMTAWIVSQGSKEQ